MDGCPTYVNAVSSETNWRASAEYGNHKSVSENPNNAIKGKPTKPSTIGNHLRDTASLLANSCGRDPRFAAIPDKQFTPPIRAILHECKRHEDIPNRVDPYTVEMHGNLLDHNNCRQAHQDGADRAIEDWYNLGFYLGFRLLENAQYDRFRHFASGGEQADIPQVLLHASGSAPSQINFPLRR